MANRFDTYPALQRILTEAIAALEPAPDTPSELRAWRIYELLFYRYVQQHTVRMVADQLGVTVRHLRREQRAALDALAYRLWRQFNLEAKVGGELEAGSSGQAAVAGPTVNDELAWLKDSPPEEPTELKPALATVLELMRPLATQHGVCLETATADTLPALAVHQVALNQTLLNLLSVAIPQAAGSRVHISARPRRWEVEIEVRCTKTGSGPPPGSDDVASLDLAHRLAELCGGQLVLSDDESVFRATLTVPAVEQLQVLAIDDNVDTLQLLQRYAAGTRYHLVGTRAPEEALGLAEKLSPQIIVLDVMMPRVDGWRVLGQLRQHPLTAHIPIVVCTILAQESLALSLGASGFLRKPVTQEAFLAALDRQVERLGLEPG